jgi:hypothetical protein
MKRTGANPNTTELGYNVMKGLNVLCRYKRVSL